MVNLNAIDIGTFVVFIVIVIGFSMFKSRRGKTSEDYFLASRDLKWWLIGFSIVAANLSTEQFVGMAGQGAGNVGLAVSSWQLTGSIGIVIVAFYFLPRFLRSGIYTMPEYLEYRYNPAARGIMAFYTMVIYVAVTITAVLYSGGLTLNTIFDIELSRAIWLIGGLAALYTTWGGLKAVAWADLFQGSTLLVGGLLTMILGFKAVGGVSSLFEHNADRLHMILPATHPDIPWTALLLGMWVPIFYYCGLNQFIVQRTLAAKSLREGQLGIIFAAALWLLVPFAIVLPGVMALQLYGDQMGTADQAYPLLIKNLIPVGLRGFMFAAISGAVMSSLASMLNSASTIFTMDLYRRCWRENASQKALLTIGRATTVLFVITGCLIAPNLADPRFKGVFNYIQEFQIHLARHSRRFCLRFRCQARSSGRRGHGSAGERSGLRPSAVEVRIYRLPKPDGFYIRFRDCPDGCNNCGQTPCPGQADARKEGFRYQTNPAGNLDGSGRDLSRGLIFYRFPLSLAERGKDFSSSRDILSEKRPDVPASEMSPARRD